MCLSLRRWSSHTPEMAAWWRARFIASWIDAACRVGSTQTVALEIGKVCRGDLNEDAPDLRIGPFRIGRLTSLHAPRHAATMRNVVPAPVVMAACRSEYTSEEESCSSRLKMVPSSPWLVVTTNAIRGSGYGCCFCIHISIVNWSGNRLVSPISPLHTPSNSQLQQYSPALRRCSCLGPQDQELLSLARSGGKLQLMCTPQYHTWQRCLSVIHFRL